MRSWALCGQIPTGKQPKLLIVTDHQAHLPAGRCTLGRPIVCAKASVRSAACHFARRQPESWWMPSPGWQASSCEPNRGQAVPPQRAMETG